jgi:hypothetical protein
MLCHVFLQSTPESESDSGSTSKPHLNGTAMHNGDASHNGAISHTGEMDSSTQARARRRTKERGPAVVKCKCINDLLPCTKMTTTKRKEIYNHIGASAARPRTGALQQC